VCSSSSSELLPTPNGAEPMMMRMVNVIVGISSAVGLDGVDKHDGTGILLSQSESESHIRQEEMKRALPDFRSNDSP
jgi:hypothetical protein